jgi:xanthine dehydrogenase YagS FAD-binding subunit
VEGPGGAREIAFDALHRLPGDTPEQETALAPGELVTAVRVPAKAAAFASHARYLKLRERTSYAFAVVSVAAALLLEDGVIREARLALGGVAAKPWRAHEAEALLAGATPSAEAFARAAEAALASARPSGENAFKITLARGLLVRALDQALAGTPERTPALPASLFASASGAVHAV